MFYFSDVTPIPEPSVSLVGLLGALGNLGTPIDLYSATTQYVDVSIGIWSIGSTSDKQIQFKIVGKNGNSSGFTQCIDSITMTPQ